MQIHVKIGFKLVKIEHIQVLKDFEKILSRKNMPKEMAASYHEMDDARARFRHMDETMRKEARALAVQGRRPWVN